MDGSDSPSTSSGAKHAAVAVGHVDRIAILGTGLYGRTLAKRMMAYPGLNVVVGSRSPCEGKSVSFENAVSEASIVFLAIPASAHEDVMEKISPHLRRGTVLVDVSNSYRRAKGALAGSNAETLAKLSGEFPVLKAFNTVSAYELDAGHMSKTTSVVHIAGDDYEAVSELSRVARTMGMIPIHAGGLSEAGDLEDMPHRIFPRWRFAVILSAAVLLFWWVYRTIATYVVHGSRGEPSLPWRKYPLIIFESATAEACITLFALSLCPIASFVQLFRGSSSKPFGRALGGWLSMRKEVGICAFWLACCHGIAGAVTKSHLNEDSGYKEQLYFVFGIIAFMLYALLAVSSNSAVTSAMSWKEFHFVFAQIGTLALAFGVAHQAVWGAIITKHIPSPSAWPGSLMPAYWLGMIIPALVIAMRLTTWTPCVHSAIHRVRGDRTK